MEELLQIVSDAYAGYSNYLYMEMTGASVPWYRNYFYGLIAISLVVWAFEIIIPWRKNQPVFRRDFWLDGFYMFFNFFLFSLIAYNALSNVCVVWLDRGLETISIQSLSYRFSMRDSWQVADLNWAMSLGEMVQWEGNLPSGTTPLVKISYTGGLAASVDALPKSFTDLATMLVVRFFKEARTGYGDSIGVAELGTLKYTEAFPARLIESINVGEWARMAPWI